jgi:hypothetical protein
MYRLYVLAIAIVIAGGLCGGVYSISGTGQGMTMVINRFTGKVWSCNILACAPVEFKTSN